MNTYKVWIGSSSSIVNDVLIIRAKNCAQAEKKALEKIGGDFSERAHVVKIEELEGEFIE